MELHKTRNDLKSSTKTTVAALLNARLADAIDLALMTKQAHWNLRGRHFIAVHEMLDGFRIEIDGHVDILAERVAQSVEIALGTTQAVVGRLQSQGLSHRYCKRGRPCRRAGRALRRSRQCDPGGNRRIGESRRC